jgi:RHS repeat-associated protein
MATTTELSEKPHQGFEGFKAALYLASTEDKSNTASGLPVWLWREGTGSRSSGKERDETGLDYFGARYYSGPQGRFTSPDKPIIDQYRIDPQSWNLYTYARNNPYLYTDPTGEKIELIGNDAQRGQALAMLRIICGNSCDFTFDKNLEEEGRYVITGVVGADEEVPVVQDLVSLINNPRIVEFGLTSRDLSGWGGAATFKPGQDGDNKNIRVLVNPNQMTLATDRLAIKNARDVTQAMRWEGYGANKVRPVTSEIATWHEFGHAWRYMNRWFTQWRDMSGTNKEALRWENRMRERLYGEFGPNNARRRYHTANP